MILTPDDVAAARAIGCAFFPATELQVQRLTMQRRIFTIDGKRYLVSRDGSYFETAGTLRALIDKAMPAMAPPAEMPAPAVETAPAAETAEPEAAPPPAAEAAPPAVQAAEPEPAPAAEAVPEPSPAEPAPPSPPRRRGRPPKSAVPPEAAPPGDEPAPPAEEGTATPRRRTKEAQPRWKTAGLARRGRLKPTS